MHEVDLSDEWAALSEQFETDMKEEPESRRAAIPAVSAEYPNDRAGGGSSEGGATTR